MKLPQVVFATATALYAAPIVAAQMVVFQDDFEDNTNTGWDYFNRNGAEEVADASWVETGGRLEQQTANYDFPRDAENDPVLGSMAIAPQLVGGHYEVSATFSSLEPGNEFQDEDVVFGYIDQGNFFYVETIPNRIVLFNTVDGNRMLVEQADGVIFSHEPITVTVEHNAVTGDVVVTYGDNEPLAFNNEVFVRDGEMGVGVGSNNDAFATDDFTITSLDAQEAPLLITGVERDPETGNVTITWDSVLDRQYFVERSTDLVRWGEVDDPTGAAGSTDYTDPNVPADKGVYYRVTE